MICPDCFECEYWQDGCTQGVKYVKGHRCFLFVPARADYDKNVDAPGQKTMWEVEE
jgi:hypothetical protein